MKITDHINEKAFGTPITYRHYEPETFSPNYVLFLHGMGERGPLDGSKLYLVEKLGWPGMAKGIRPGDTVSKGSIEFPFHIIAPQIETSYSVLIKFIIGYLIYKFGAKGIVPIGISLGGIAVDDLLLHDPAQRMKAIVPVCGKGLTSRISEMRPIEGWAWHGDKDTVVSYASDKAFVDAYNAEHGPAGHIKFETLPGVAHNAWDYAFKPTSGLLEWVTLQFADHEEDDFAEGRNSVISQLESWINTLKAE